MNFRYSILEVENDIAIIELEGELNFKQDASELSKEFEKRLILGKINYILNLKQIEHINSSGLNILIMMLTRTRKVGGEAIVTNVSQKVQKLFAITRLNSFFILKENNEDAILELKNIKNK